VRTASPPTASEELPSKADAAARPKPSADNTASAETAPPECAPVNTTKNSHKISNRKVQTRTGSSIALVEEAGRKLIYVADEDNRAIHTLDATENLTELAVTELPGRPAQLLPLADGRILVTLRDRNRLVALEPRDLPEQGLEIRCERATFTEPWGLAVSADGARVAVTAGWDHKLSLLAAGSLSTERLVDLPAEPRGVLISEDGETAFVAHLMGGILTQVSLNRPDEPPRRSFLRPENPRPKPAKNTKSAHAGAKEPNKSQELAAAQGFAIAALSMGKTEDGRAWPERIFVPMASSDPMQFGAVNSFPGVYGGSGGPAVIGAFVAVVDPVSGAALGGEVAPLRAARPEDCILPRGVAIHKNRLLVTCLGIDRLVELDTRAVDPISAERRRFRVGAGPTGVVVDAETDRALVFSQWSGEISVVDLAEPATTDANTDTNTTNTTILRLARPEVPDLSPKLARGRALFHVTRDVRMSSDGRACASCHPDGRADGLTWATPDGPRQTISLAGRGAGPGPLGWFGDHPTAKSHIAFTVRRLGGHGFETAADREDFDALLAYLTALPAPSREGALEAEGVPELRARGRDLFFARETGCSDCHLGASTDGRRHDVGSGDWREKRLSFDTPALRLVAGSAPYFHDGRYLTLMDMLSDPKSKMGRSAHLSLEDRRALVAYLESL
jgi:mono/diheme cytochrome c family protein